MWNYILLSFVTICVFSLPLREKINLDLNAGMTQVSDEGTEGGSNFKSDGLPNDGNIHGEKVNNNEGYDDESNGKLADLLKDIYLLDVKKASKASLDHEEGIGKKDDEESDVIKDDAVASDVIQDEPEEVVSSNEGSENIGSADSAKGDGEETSDTLDEPKNQDIVSSDISSDTNREVSDVIQEETEEENHDLVSSDEDDKNIQTTDNISTDTKDEETSDVIQEEPEEEENHDLVSSDEDEKDIETTDNISTDTKDEETDVIQDEPEDGNLDLLTNSKAADTKDEDIDVSPFKPDRTDSNDIDRETKQVVKVFLPIQRE